MFRPYYWLHVLLVEDIFLRWPVWVCGIETIVLWVGATVVVMFPHFPFELSLYVLCIYNFGRVIVPLPPYIFSRVLLVEDMTLP